MLINTPTLLGLPIHALTLSLPQTATLTVLGVSLPDLFTKRCSSKPTPPLTALMSSPLPAVDPLSPSLLPGLLAAAMM
ncbi:hypothetical protein BC829DRAFT_403296 [Chytridium lagenaria]|nr:hypothetical protein BC829DRAFT_403296 [Chytridium lagenaria]